MSCPVANQALQRLAMGLKIGFQTEIYKCYYSAVTGWVQFISIFKAFKFIRLVLAYRCAISWSESFCATIHLLSIKHAEWPKLHDMFKACDTKTWHCKFLVRFPDRICALHLLCFDITRDIVVCIESRCMIKAKHVLLNGQSYMTCLKHVTLKHGIVIFFGQFSR